MDNIYFYLKGEYKTEDTEVALCDICKVYHSAQGYLHVDEAIKFEGNLRIVSSLVIGQMLTKKFPNASIQSMGANETVLKRMPKADIKNILLTAGLCIILFFGGAMGIMTFSQDVSLNDMLRDLHKFYTGEIAERVPAISIPLAVGVGVGFLAVLQIFRKKSSPPGLIDITLDEFETQIDDYSIKRQG